MLNTLKVVSWTFRKICNYTNGVNDLLQLPIIIGNAANNKITYISKITGASTKVSGAFKNLVDTLEVLVCQDGVCFVVFRIENTAHELEIIASFIVGLNITTPLSLGCKAFVYCYKHFKLGWSGC